MREETQLMQAKQTCPRYGSTNPWTARQEFAPGKAIPPLAYTKVTMEGSRTQHIERIGCDSPENGAVLEQSG